MASLYQLKNGKYRLDYTDVTGERFQVNTGTTDLNVAKLWLAKAEELLSLTRLGRMDRVGKIGADVVHRRQKEKSYRLSEFERLHEERTKEEAKLSESYLGTIKNATDSLRASQGDKLIQGYSIEDVRSWDQWMQQREYKKTTRSMYGRALKATWNRARRWKIVTENPFAEYKWPTSRETRRREHAMSVDELVKFLETIDADPRERQFGVYVRMGIYTGKRRSEILAVKAEDINLENRVMIIPTLKRKDGPVRTAIPINEPLYQILSELDLRKGEYLFKTNARVRKLRQEGRPWTKWYVTHHFKKVLIKACLPGHYTLHSLRRAYVTYLRSQDVPREAIQKLLGQVSSTVLDEYDETDALDFRHHSEKMDFGDPGIRRGKYRPGTDTPSQEDTRGENQ